MSYCSFWVDANSAPARVILCSTIVLITIYFRDEIADHIPKLRERSWLENFVSSTLFLTVIPMLEYAVVNFSITYVKTMNKATDI